MSNSSTNEFLTPDEAAKMLRLSKQTIYKWAEKGKIPCRKFGPKCLRFLFSDLEEFSRNPARVEVAK